MNRSRLSRWWSPRWAAVVPRLFCLLLVLLLSDLLLRGENDVFEGPVGQARAAPTFLLQTIVKCAVNLVVVLDVIPRYVRFELR